MKKSDVTTAKYTTLVAFIVTTLTMLKIQSIVGEKALPQLIPTEDPLFTAQPIISILIFVLISSVGVFFHLTISLILKTASLRKPSDMYIYKPKTNLHKTINTLYKSNQILTLISGLIFSAIISLSLGYKNNVIFSTISFSDTANSIQTYILLLTFPIASSVTSEILRHLIYIHIANEINKSDKYHGHIKPTHIRFFGKKGLSKSTTLISKPRITNSFSKIHKETTTIIWGRTLSISGKVSLRKTKNSITLLDDPYVIKFIDKIKTNTPRKPHDPLMDRRQ